MLGVVAVSQDGITAFEALESGALPPLRELLMWLESATVRAAAHRSRSRRPTSRGVKVATELEVATVDALAAVSSGGVKGAAAGDGSPSSEAVLQVMSVLGGLVAGDVLVPWFR